MMFTRSLLLFALLWHSSSAMILERHSNKLTKDVSIEDKPPPDSHGLTKDVSSEENPPPDFHELPKGIASEENPPPDSNELPKGISSEQNPPPESNELIKGISSEENPPPDSHELTKGISSEENPPPGSRELKKDASSEEKPSPDSGESTEEISSEESPPDSHELTKGIPSEENPPPDSHELTKGISSEENPPPDSRELKKDASSEEKPSPDSDEFREEISSEESPPDSHELTKGISSEENPSPDSHGLTKDASSEEKPSPDSGESTEEISSEEPPPDSGSGLEQEDDDRMTINSTVVLLAESDRKRRPTVHTSTPIPNCPSYVSCPWIYPQPITTESSDQKENTNSISEDVSGSTSTKKPVKQEEEGPVAQYFGAESNEPESADNANNTASSSENRPKPQGMTEDSEKRVTDYPGHEKQRPTVPTSTPIPNCPSYVSCPWVYPQPITTESSDQVHNNPKPISEGGSEISLTEKPSNSLVEHFGGQRNESNSGDKIVGNASVPENGPSISATQKPQYPSYVPGPWIYPKPIGEGALETTSTKKPENIQEEALLEEHFGGQVNESGSNDNYDSTTSNSENRPSISATQKPQYPSYVPGPWIYPKPIGEGVYQISTTKKPDNLQEEALLEEHFGGQVNESGSNDNYGSTASNSENRPSISATQKPQYPSYVPGPWIYPKPIGEGALETTSTKKPENIQEEALLEEHFGGQVNESGSNDTDGSTASNSENRPSISATQKPQYPSYVPGPWIYPKPIGEGVYQISTTKKPDNPLLAEHFGLEENESGSGDKVGSSASSSKPQAPGHVSSTTTTTEIPDCPSFVSCPWIYPQPITDTPLTEHLGGPAGSSEDMIFPGPTTRYPPKKPAKRPSLLNNLRNKNGMVADRFAVGIDFEDDLTDIIETYASNFFYYSPSLTRSETSKPRQALPFSWWTRAIHQPVSSDGA